MNMKKTYIAPESYIVDIEMESLLQAISGSTGLDGTGWGGEAEDDFEADAKVNNGFSLDVWD